MRALLLEPCLRGGRCLSPVACGGWGYCRERNFGGGIPSDLDIGLRRVEGENCAKAAAFDELAEALATIADMPSPEQDDTLSARMREVAGSAIEDWVRT